MLLGFSVFYVGKHRRVELNGVLRRIAHAKELIVTRPFLGTDAAQVHQRSAPRTLRSQTIHPQPSGLADFKIVPGAEEMLELASTEQG